MSAHSDLASSVPLSWTPLGRQEAYCLKSQDHFPDNTDPRPSGIFSSTVAFGKGPPSAGGEATTRSVPAPQHDLVAGSLPSSPVCLNESLASYQSLRVPRLTPAPSSGDDRLQGIPSSAGKSMCRGRQPWSSLLGYTLFSRLQKEAFCNKIFGSRLLPLRPDRPIPLGSIATVNLFSPSLPNAQPHWGSDAGHQKIRTQSVRRLKSGRKHQKPEMAAGAHLG